MSGSPRGGAGPAEIHAVAARTFTMADQLAFAALSGDHNPLHMDPVTARRTAAGACVVHGVQALAWALEQLAPLLPLRELRGLDADFSRFLLVGEPATLVLSARAADRVVAELRTGSTRAALYRLRFDGAADPPPADPPSDTPPADAFPPDAIVPLAPDWIGTAAAAGTMPFFRSDADPAASHPGLSAAIGADRVAGLLALTRLVGMVSPGLHSTFHRIELRLVARAAAPGAAGRLRFETVASDARFSTVSIAVHADGLDGRVRASRRAPPAAQPGSIALRDLVAPRRFPGNTALVVGGSRGLGEVTAKLLGLAGVDTILTYNAGAAEAHAVVDDIVAAGGRARALRLDVSSPSAAFLDALPAVIGSLYFFATPRIAGNPGSSYAPELFRSYLGVYVDAFHALCACLSARGDRPLHVFYPSTVFVSEPTRAMAEYAMAKAAGEILAADMTSFMPNVRVEVVRLPRLPTDQTAGLFEREMASVAETMLPIVLRIEDRASADARAR
ncbi:MAG: SDR family NAD(P)-dependent oxidoreductase [Gluconacetobacter diazotrophicus]|nr:SDR family NAD(P)-dependent oxidoreductase [Gluconacetobacter diazotrophicus]